MRAYSIEPGPTLNLVLVGVFTLLLLLVPSMSAQQANGIVPTFVSFAGFLSDADGKPLPGPQGVTFSLYKDQQGGSPLWMETQNVQADHKGRYSVVLGSTTSQGLPAELFASGEAKWLGVQAQGQSEQPRVMLLAVPYALKAGDAQTVGGLPPSAFVLAPPPTTVGNGGDASSSASSSNASSTSGPGKKSKNANVAGTGTKNYVPLWTDNNGTLGNSVFYQSGSGSSARVGLNVTAPLATLDVNGETLIRGTLEPVTKGYATAQKGFNSNPLDLEASSFSSTTQQPVMQHFEWQAEPTGNDTNAPGATLNLLFGQNTFAPAETGLVVSDVGALTVQSGVTGFSTSASNAGVNGQNAVGGYGILGQATGTTGQGVWGESFGTASANGNGPDGVHGVNHSSNGAGVAGLSQVGPRQTPGIGVYGQGSPGVYGIGGGLTYTGVEGVSNGFGTGVYGSSALGNGVYGSSTSGTAVYGVSTSSTAVYGVSTSGAGVYGSANTQTTAAVVGMNTFQDSSYGGVYGSGWPGARFDGGGYSQNLDNEYGGDGADANGGDTNSGVPGVGLSAIGGFNFDSNYGNYGVWASGVNNSQDAGYFNGNVEINGNLSKNGGSFKIDHPLDPANKYLYHSFVESPDMKNVYDGVAVLDGNGQAEIQLPEWFQSLNRDFRYQLTCIGGFAPVYVAKEISNNRFQIAGGRVGLKISWQVTGIRQDPWANAHRIPVEEEKNEQERGYYLHPELYGQPDEKHVEWARHPQLMERVREHRMRNASRRSVPNPQDSVRQTGTESQN